jgi:hypothetical protein
MQKRNLENQRFGRLLVIKRLPTRRTSGGNPVAQWLCFCDCRNEKIVSTGSLLGNKVKSCGCYLIDTAKEKGYRNATHGNRSKFASLDDTIKQLVLDNIKDRSRKRGYETDLDFSDLPELTDTCPVFGTRYTKGSLKNKDFVPTIDRKNSSLPYLKEYKDNLIFISHKANRIKSDATIETLEKIVDYIQAKSHSSESKSASFDFDFKKLLWSIRSRARRKGYECDLEISDLPFLPEKCPVLGIPLALSRGYPKEGSPSIDRKNNNLPYLKKYKDNLSFISYRANAIKSNATVEDLLAVIKYMNTAARDENSL